MVLSPIIINFDWTTILWFNSFFLKLKESLVKSNQEDSVNSYFDVKIEAVLPKVGLSFFLFLFYNFYGIFTIFYVLYILGYI